MRAILVKGCDDADDACDDAEGVIKGTSGAPPRRIECACGVDAVGFANLLNMADQTKRDIKQAAGGLIV